MDECRKMRIYESSLGDVLILLNFYDFFAFIALKDVFVVMASFDNHTRFNDKLNSV